ncbi:MAG: glycosyltransferase family 4 protein [Verrucomicrobiota bacterium]
MEKVAFEDRKARAIRVLHVETGRHLYGGAQQVVYLMENLPALGVECGIVCAAGSEIADKALAAGATVFSPRIGGDLDIRLAYHVMRAARVWRADIVHVQSRRGADTWGLLGAKLAGKRLVISRRVDNWEFAWLGRMRFGAANHVICISDGVLQVLLRMGVSQDRMSIVHSAIDPNRFNRPASQSELREEFGLAPEVPILGIAAQLIQRKGHLLVFEALRRLESDWPHLYLIVFGRGPIEAELKAAAIELGLENRVVFAGFRNDLPRWVGALDLLVHPAYMEGLGNVLLQAAAAGVPCIGTRVGGIPEAMGGGKTGILIPVGDSDALAEAISRMLSDSSLRRRFAEEGPRFVDSGFTASHLAVGNANVYRQVMAG